MMKRKAILFLGLGLLIGCGGGGGGQSVTSDQCTSDSSKPYIASGVSNLNDVISNKSSDTLVSLSTSATNFKKAYSVCPSGTSATGYVLAQAAYDGQTLTNLIGNTSRSRSSTGNEFLTALFAKSSLWAGGKFGMLPLPTSLGEVIPSAVLANASSRAYPQDPTPAQMIAQIRTIDQDLTALQNYLTNSNIEALESNPLVLTYVDSDQATKSLKVGRAEGYALRSGVELLKGATDLLLAYNLDSGTTWSLNADFLTTYGAKLQVGVLKSSDYLPAAPCLSLNSDGATRLKEVGTIWLSASDDAQKAIDALSARTTTGWLANLTNYTSTDLSVASGYVNEFHTFLSGLSGPITVPINGQNEVIRFSAFTGGNPPSSLRIFFPSLEFVPGSTTSLQPVQGSYPDNTFGGLVPTGLPDAVMYSRSYYIGSRDDNLYQIIEWLLTFNTTN